MILVTGATGNVGRPLVRELAASGARVRALVRDDARAAALLPAGVERVVGDLGDPASLPAAFDGARRVFLLNAGTGARHTHHALRAARAAGTQHLVLLSSAHAALDPPPAMARWHREREEAVRGSGIAATILRPGGFMSNALEWAPAVRAGAAVLDPSGPGRYAPIDPDDVAAVAAHVLTRDGYEDQAYTLTGEEAFTVAEQVAVLAAALGGPIAVREAATPDEAVRARYPNGAPPQLAEAIAQWFTLMRADTTGLRTDTVRQLLGRPPRTFADWCARHLDAFRPAAAA